MSSSDLEDFYTKRHNESDRLASTLRGQLERERVREFLVQYMPPPPATIADIGGGPGVHAVWLRHRGYDVQLLDPIQRHINEARAAGLSAIRGDARNLPWDSGSVHVVLMAGPIYHLTDPRDRRLALREATRVLRSGGLLFVTAMNRSANIVETALRRTPNRRNGLPGACTDSFATELGWPVSTTYHTIPMLRAELAQVATVIGVHGLTGVGDWLSALSATHCKESTPSLSVADHPALEAALECSRLADQFSHLAHASSRLLGVGLRD